MTDRLVGREGVEVMVRPARKADSFAAAAWARFKLISRAIGNFQSRVLLTLFYFLILAPFGLGVRLFRDPLRLKFRHCSHWLHRGPERRVDWESARRQS